jgi:L-ascorbate metabolism protein UlaG (beta-lactamase superfamily)
MVDRKLSVKGESVEELIGGIQFDRWIFGYPTRFTLISHGHTDHDPLASSFNFPQPIIYCPKTYTPKRNANALRLQDGEKEKIGDIIVSALGSKTLTRLTGLTISRLHACWWIISTKKLLVLFVGELDVADISVLSKLLELIPHLDAVLLPSYGGINPPAHGSSFRDELKDKIATLAISAKNKGCLVYALPHPVVPDWAEFYANRV